ncbi:MAG TPA: LytR C-terminal domain-containing protein [Actinomycetota bacterium]|nr:LytR C-terminal domain-containing protein [Actinomycetota bacterium]
MGRHSSRDQRPFLLSVARWLTVWLVVAAATGVAVWVVVNSIGKPQINARLGRGERHPRAETTSPSSEPTVAVVDTASPEPTQSASPSDTEDKALHAQGVTVQVLNGTVQPDAGQAMATRLERLGYTIVAIEESSRAYPTTTVYWSTGASQDAARALAERFGWDAAPRPSNLSPEVAIHVVVGADEGTP